MQRNIKSNNKITAISFLALGAVLCLTGYFCYLSTLSGGGSSNSVFVKPSDTTVWLMIFGLLAGITGAFGFVSDGEKNKH